MNRGGRGNLNISIIYIFIGFIARYISPTVGNVTIEVLKGGNYNELVAQYLTEQNLSQYKEKYNKWLKEQMDEYSVNFINDNIEIYHVTDCKIKSLEEDETEKFETKFDEILKEIEKTIKPINSEDTLPYTDGGGKQYKKLNKTNKSKSK